MLFGDVAVSPSSVVVSLHDLVLRKSLCCPKHQLLAEMVDCNLVLVHCMHVYCLIIIVSD